MKNLRVLAFGDFHANPFGEFSRSIDSEGSTLLSEFITNTASWIAHNFNNSVFDFLINNGDFSHTPGTMNAPTIRLLSRIERIFGEIPRIYNIGNHDLDGKVGLHNLELNGLIPGVEKMVQPGRLLEYCGLYFVPYTYSMEQQEKLINEIPDGSIAVVHTPIRGIFMGSSVLDPHGVDPKIFNRFRLTIASHYHIPQVISNGSIEVLTDEGFHSKDIPFGTVVMMGTPCAHSFDDKNQQYGIWRFRFNDDEAEVKFLPNPESPRFVSSKAETADEILEILTKQREEKTFFSITAPKEAIDEALKSGIDFPDVRFRREKKKLDVARTSVLKQSQLSDVKTTIKQYVSTLDDDNLDPEEVVEFISPLLNSMGAKLSDSIGGHVTFKSLKLKNFLSWENAELGFDSPGELFLISGVNQDTTTASSNGSGKSSLLESLVWCLYDTTYRDLPNKNSVVRKDSDECEVSVSFSTDEGEFVVTRSRKSSGKGAVSILKNGDEISRGNIAAVNSQIVEAVGIPYDVFSYITLFGSGNNNRFTLMGDADKKRFLGRIFNLQNYELLRIKVKEFISELQKHKTALSANIDTLSASIFRIESTIKEKTREANSKEAERNDKLSAIRKELRILKENRSIIDQSIGELRRAELPLQETKKKLEDVINSGSGGVRIQLDAALSNLKTCLERIERHGKKLETVNRKVEKKQGEIEGFSMDCPTCNQPLPQEKVNEVLVQLSVDLDELLNEREEILVSIDSSKSDAKILEEKADELDTQIREFGNEERESLKNIGVELSGVQKELAEKTAHLNGLVSKYQLLEKQENSLENEDYFVGIKALEETLEKEGEALLSKKEKLEENNRTLSFTSRVWELLGPSAVISYVLDSGIEELNNYLSEISSGIYGDDYSISLSSVRELGSGAEENKISVVYSTQAGCYGASSDGEKRKADISIFLSLHSLASALGTGSTNLIVADEALDSLDSVASKAVIDTINKYASEEQKQVFLVSHSDNVVPFVNNVVWVERKNGVSTMKN